MIEIREIENIQAHRTRSVFHVEYKVSSKINNFILNIILISNILDILHHLYQRGTMDLLAGGINRDTNLAIRTHA